MSLKSYFPGLPGALEKQKYPVQNGLLHRATCVLHSVFSTNLRTIGESCREPASTRTQGKPHSRRVWGAGGRMEGGKQARRLTSPTRKGENSQNWIWLYFPPAGKLQFIFTLVPAKKLKSKVKKPKKPKNLFYSKDLLFNLVNPYELC